MSWLRKAGKLAESVSEALPDSVKDKIDVVVQDVVTDKLNDIDLGDTVESFKVSGMECNQISKETSELCACTISKSAEMVAFGQDIQATLREFKQGETMDASAFESIRDLVSGDKMKAATALAGEMDNLALTCVDKSIEMITSIERGVDSLPDVMKEGIDAAAKNGANEDDPELPSVDKDIQELETCIEAIQQVNLFTAMDAGLNAFNGLTAKGEICTDMFATMKRFAENVTSITDAFMDLNVKTVLSKLKDMWRCLRLSDLMKSFAEEVGKLIKWIIKLFTDSSDKLSGIWSALAYAKDCMADCIKPVVEAKQLCIDAMEKSTTLIHTTTAIKGQLESIASVNAKSINAVQELSDGDEIRLAIDLATSMDDLVSRCVAKVVNMTDRVSDGFENLPNVITEGMPDVKEAGKVEDDPKPADVEQDIEKMDKCRSAIEDADTLCAVKAGVDGFSGVANEVDICKGMLNTSLGFANNCTNTIESFMGVWDLNTAMDKIMEMCRLVKLGDMMKQFAEQIKKLVKATIAVMKAAKEKLGNLSFAEVKDEVKDKIEDTVEDVKEMVDDVTDMAKKIKFW